MANDSIKVCIMVPEALAKSMDKLCGRWDKPFRSRSDLLRYGAEQLVNEYTEHFADNDRKIPPGVDPDRVTDDGYIIDDEGYAVPIEQYRPNK